MKSRIACGLLFGVATVATLLTALAGIHVIISLSLFLTLVTALALQWRTGNWARNKQKELQKLALIASETRDLVIITDARGRIEWVNAAFTALTGYELEEVEGERPGDFLQGSGTDKRTVKKMGDALQAHQTVTVDLLNYTKTGKPYWVQVRIQPVFENSRLVRFFSIQTDITQRRQDERKLELALEEAQEASRAKTRFLATMSHELRTPLNAINGYAQMMDGELLGPVGNDRYRAYVSDILSSGTYLLELIESVLSLGDLDNGTANVKQECVDVGQLFADVESVTRPRASKMNKTLVVWDSPALVIGDNRALKQTVINLVDNALKYSDDDSTVKVYCARVPMGYRITVEDDGPGIPEADLPRITDAFYRTATNDAWKAKPEGTGIGLSLVKEYVRAMGGDFEIDSQEGVGTCVHIRLPSFVTAEVASC